MNIDFNLSKSNTFDNDIIFIDGLWGCGKSMISPIVSGMYMVEKVKIEDLFENLGFLLSLNKITEDAAKTLIQIYVDKILYYSLLGREVNFRIFDDTGIFRNPNPYRYIKRLFKKDIQINNKLNYKKALCIMGHMNIFNFNLLENSIGSKLKFIEVVRHPIYIYDHWYNYLKRFDDPYELTLSTQYKGVKIPWFAIKWKKEYLGLSIADRALKGIIYNVNKMIHVINENKSKKKTFLTMSFESIIFKTENELNRLEDFLKRKHYAKIKKLLNKQKIPRKTLSSGIGNSKYGWNAGVFNEKEDFISRWRFIEANCNKDLICEFKSLINIYNKNFPSILSDYNKYL